MPPFASLTPSQFAKWFLISPITSPDMMTSQSHWYITVTLVESRFWIRTLQLQKCIREISTTITRQILFSWVRSITTPQAFRKCIGIAMYVLFHLDLSILCSIFKAEAKWSFQYRLEGLILMSQNFSKMRLNQEPAAVLELTKTLLRHDFNLDWVRTFIVSLVSHVLMHIQDMPLNRLCPTVTNRTNYIHWSNMETLSSYLESPFSGLKTYWHKPQGSEQWPLHAKGKLDSFRVIGAKR